MKANKAVKRLGKIESLLADVSKGYEAAAPLLRSALENVKAAMARAKEAVTAKPAKKAKAKSKAKAGGKTAKKKAAVKKADAKASKVTAGKKKAPRKKARKKPAPAPMPGTLEATAPPVVV